MYMCAGDNNITSNKSNLPATDAVNAAADDSNAAKNSANATATSAEGAIKFVEAPLPKVNAWKVRFTVHTRQQNTHPFGAHLWGCRALMSQYLSTLGWSSPIATDPKPILSAHLSHNSRMQHVHLVVGTYAALDIDFHSESFDVNFS